MATYLTKKFKMITRMRNNKGFTLIELIMVTILLGILAAVAVPRYLGTVSKAEEAVEKGVVTQLRIAVEEYSNNQYIEYGRYQYPSNPFDIVEVEGYLGEVGVDFNYYSDDIGLNGYDGSCGLRLEILMEWSGFYMVEKTIQSMDGPTIFRTCLLGHLMIED